MALNCASVRIESWIFCAKNGPAPDANGGHAGRPGPFGIAGGREPRPLTDDLVRQRYLGALEFAWLGADLVQIHSQSSAVPAREHELNIGRVRC